MRISVVIDGRGVDRRAAGGQLRIGDHVGDVERVLVGFVAIGAGDVVDQPLVERPGVDLAFPVVDDRVAEAIGLGLLIGHARGEPGLLGRLLGRRARAPRAARRSPPGGLWRRAGVLVGGMRRRRRRLRAPPGLSAVGAWASAAAGRHRQGRAPRRRPDARLAHGCLLLDDGDCRYFQPTRSISLTASGLFSPYLAALTASVLISPHASSTGSSLTPATTGNSLLPSAK